MSTSVSETAMFPAMRHSFTGRVKNFNLPPTAANSMMPVYEAVTNALYAIQERFPDTWADEGVITIEILRDRYDEKRQGPQPEHERVNGFVVSDNGLGLNDKLFGHFQELDTEYRADKRGRGIGRLSWLKVFKSTNVVSVFDRGWTKAERSFEFRLSNENPFANYAESGQPTEASNGTIIHLDGYRDVYVGKAFSKPEDIRNSLLAHFIALLAQPKRLKINLVDEGKVTNLSDLFFDSIVGVKTPVQVSVGEGLSVDMLHLLLPKKLAPIGNSIIYCAADRSVMTKPITEVIGLKSLPSEEHGGLIYIGLVSGNLFDDGLNHERTGFDLGDIDFEDVNKHVVQAAKVFLDPYLAERRLRNRELLDKVLSDNPLYLSAIGDMDKYVAEMPLNWDETKLVQDIALRRHRANKALFKQVEKLEANSASMSDEVFAAHVTRISAELGDAEKGALAQYIVERKWVIELLKERRRLDANTLKHQSETIVHEVFCPLGVTSDTLDYDDHNLWLIDDRLAYYSYVTSDRPIKSFADDAKEIDKEEVARREELHEIGAYSEGSEPDLAIFQRPMLFRRSHTMDPVVIVEFKSPRKTAYTGAPNDNPVMQIRKYVETLQAKRCYTWDRERITDINDKTAFLCYLIAEPSEQLYSLLKAHSIYKPTPDGNGRFAYLEDINAYFEFIPYDQVLKNASLRNEAFFKRLKIEKITASHGSSPPKSP